MEVLGMLPYHGANDLKEKFKTDNATPFFQLSRAYFQTHCVWPLASPALGESFVDPTNHNPTRQMIDCCYPRLSF